MSTPLDRSGRHAVVAFMAAGLVAIVILAAIGFVILRRTTTADALRDARELTRAEARIVALLITDRVMAGDPDAAALLDLAVHQQVLSRRVMGVKVWSPDGRVVYSDDPELVGQRFDLSSEARGTLRSGAVGAGLTGGHGDVKVIEGYAAVSTTAGQPALFEASVRFDTLAGDGRRALGAFAPALAGGLVVLWLAQVPLVVVPSRRRSSASARERALLARAVESSERERLLVAAGLHAIQPRLSGASASLSTIATAAARLGLSSLAGRIEGPAEELRECDGEVRGLLVSLDQWRLHAEGLAPDR